MAVANTTTGVRAGMAATGRPNIDPNDDGTLAEETTQGATPDTSSYSTQNPTLLTTEIPDKAQGLLPGFLWREPSFVDFVAGKIAQTDPKASRALLRILPKDPSENLLSDLASKSFIDVLKHAMEQVKYRSDAAFAGTALGIFPAFKIQDGNFVPIRDALAICDFKFLEFPLLMGVAVVFAAKNFADFKTKDGTLAALAPAGVVIYSYFASLSVLIGLACNERSLWFSGLAALFAETLFDVGREFVMRRSAQKGLAALLNLGVDESVQSEFFSGHLEKFIKLLVAIRATIAIERTEVETNQREHRALIRQLTRELRDPKTFAGFSNINKAAGIFDRQRRLRAARGELDNQNRFHEELDAKSDRMTAKITEVRGWIEKRRELDESIRQSKASRASEAIIQRAAVEREEQMARVSAMFAELGPVLQETSFAYEAQLQADGEFPDPEFQR